MLLGGVGVPWLLVVVASLGNILGAVLNWWLGMELERFSGRRWFPVPRLRWNGRSAGITAGAAGRCC